MFGRDLAELFQLSDYLLVVRHIASDVAPNFYPA